MGYDESVACRSVVVAVAAAVVVVAMSTELVLPSILAWQRGGWRARS